MKTCEVTRKKAQATEGKRPDILSRRVDVPELKSKLRLKLSAEGIKIIKDAGGIAKYLADIDEAKLSTKLKALRAKLIDKGAIKIKVEKPVEEVAPAEAAAEEAAPAEEAPKEEAATE